MKPKYETRSSGELDTEHPIRVQTCEQIPKFIFKKYGLKKSKKNLKDLKIAWAAWFGKECSFCKCQMKLFENFQHQPDEMTIDHIKKKSKGGKNHLANLHVICKTCNQYREK